MKKSESFCRIKIRHHRHKYYTLVDKEDYEKFKNYKFRINRKGYVYCKGVGLLHRLVMGLPKGDPREIHHINNNKLDNRKRYLKVVTREEHIKIHQNKLEK